MDQLAYRFYTADGDLIEIRRNGKILAEGLAASARVTREMAGIYTMGRVKPRRGKRGIAGSIVLSVVDDSLCIFSEPWELWTLKNKEADWVIFKGCEFLNDGSHDEKILTGKQYTYLCKNINKNGEDFYEDQS